MTVELDTHVLADTDGVGGAAKRGASLTLIEHSTLADMVIPAECLGEVFRVLLSQYLLRGFTWRGGAEVNPSDADEPYSLPA